VGDIPFTIFPKFFAKPGQPLDAADEFPGDWTLRELQHRISEYFLFRFRRRGPSVVASPSRTVILLAVLAVRFVV
jgi:hypothetical protein